MSILSGFVENDTLNRVYTTRTLKQYNEKQHSGKLFSFARDPETSRRWLKCSREVLKAAYNAYRLENN